LKKTPFFAEIWRKSQKIVIITSTPGHPVFERNVDDKILFRGFGGTFAVETESWNSNSKTFQKMVLKSISTHRDGSSIRVALIFLGTTYVPKEEKNLPNGHKTNQMILKYSPEPQTILTF
jgi:hypothetical protein